MLKTISEIVGLAVLAILAALAFALLGGVPVWLLWNWLVPTLFGLPPITLWQAIGLSLLSSVLFKSNSSSSSSK